MPERTILIVDDEVELAENVRDFLEFEGYRAEICPSGEEALKQVALGLPDLVLADVMLPGTDGLETLRRLKEAHPGLPVLMVSPTSQKETRDKVQEYGADGLIIKPYEQDELLAEIERILKKADK